MAIETLTTPREQLPNQFTDINAREIDFVTRFGDDWTALTEVMGITRPIEKTPGTKLVSYTAKVDLESGNVPEGAVIPYSKATVIEKKFGELTLRKYAKAVTIEDVERYGDVIAVTKTDDAFLKELQTVVLDDYYTALTDNDYAMRAAYSTFQLAVAMAIGMVKDKFKKMRKNSSRVVVWVNTLDAYEYLGADVTVGIQTLFGLDYLENVLGADTMILSSEIERGKVYATPADNLIPYYINPESAFSKLGLTYTTDGVTNLVGFHANANYTTAVGESFALMGLKLWYEYADAVAIVDIDDSSLTDLTVTADNPAATYTWTPLTPADFQSNVAVNGDKITGTLEFIEGGLATSGPLSGDGYFLALKFDGFSSGLTYANVQVGLVPSKGTGLVTLDSDKNAVFKIDNTNQKLETIQTDGKHTNIQFFDLSGLTLAE